MEKIILYIFFTIVFYFFPGVFLFKQLKFGKLPLASFFSLVINSILLFWLLYIFKNNSRGIITGYFILSAAIVFFIKKFKFIADDFFPVKDKPSRFLIICFSLVSGLLISLIFLLYLPVVTPKTLEGYRFYRFTGIGDMTKHLFVTVSIKESGLPPAHPYFPSAKLSYYYGYYILPASVALLSGIDAKITFLIHFLISTVIYLSLIFYLILEWIKEKSGRVISLFFLTFGFGWDIIPSLLIYGWGGTPHLEQWGQNFLKSPLQISSFFVGLVWVPQHMLPAVISVTIFTLLYKRKHNLKLFLIVCFMTAYCFLSSVFVGIGLAVLIFFVFLKEIIYEKKVSISIRNFGLLAAGCVILISPFLREIFSQRTNLFKFGWVYPHFNLFSLPNFPPLNWTVSMIFEFGGVIILLLILGVKYIISAKDFLFMFLSSLSIFIMVQLVSSPRSDDFGMRIITISQIIFSLLAGMIAGKFLEIMTKNKKRYLRIILLFVVSFSIFLGFFGQLYEFYGRWKGRVILNWGDSQLISWIKSQNSPAIKYAIFENHQSDLVAELIPPLTEKLIYSLDITPGGSVYLTESDAQKRADYKLRLIESIMENDSDFELQNFLKLTGDWLSYIKPDYLIFRNQIWEEEDQNSFLEIYKKIFPSSYFKVANFTLFDLKNADFTKILLLSGKETPLKKEKITAGKNEIYLNRGFYIFNFCGENTAGEVNNFSIQMERYFSLINIDLLPGEKRCGRRLFFAPESKFYFLKVSLRNELMSLLLETNKLVFN